MRVAINGLGRIGRAVFKLLVATPELELAAVNDVIPPDNLAYLLNHDTVYGRYPNRVTSQTNSLVVADQSYPVYAEPDPSRLPWRRLNVDLVFECTGRFDRRDELSKHLEAGAKRVMLSAPAKDDDVPTVVFGVNVYDEKAGPILSCASCTTNCVAPIVEIIGRHFGIRKAIMNTVHAYTASQGLVDGPNHKKRRGRAGAANLVPSTTGAATATARALPALRGRFQGTAVRAPVAICSLCDVVMLTERSTSVDEVNALFLEEARSERYEGVVGVTEDPLVSSDVIQDPRASIIDREMTQVVDGDLVKVMSWYDNEWGYASQMVRQAISMAQIVPVEPALSSR
ncbi:MAG TPA: glyceraldehyde 3-phosphate dehydrogenase NAD-binding domain-containing protein [Nitrospira sp.]|jgi:glyceraldehyde 3-phosphate dehydrogenase (phosphorylating)|nr:glyceraldehyde 3-phosphate dehydrogenase NAD-binding domain-containing protein [Nitrospira sp.]